MNYKAYGQCKLSKANGTIWSVEKGEMDHSLSEIYSGVPLNIASFLWVVGGTSTWIKKWQDSKGDIEKFKLAVRHAKCPHVSSVGREWLNENQKSTRTIRILDRRVAFNKLNVVRLSDLVGQGRVASEFSMELIEHWLLNDQPNKTIGRITNDKSMSESVDQIKRNCKTPEDIGGLLEFPVEARELLRLSFYSNHFNGSKEITLNEIKLILRQKMVELYRYINAQTYTDFESVEHSITRIPIWKESSRTSSAVLTGAIELSSSHNASLEGPGALAIRNTLKSIVKLRSKPLGANIQIPTSVYKHLKDLPAFNLMDKDDCFFDHGTITHTDHCCTRPVNILVINDKDPHSLNFLYPFLNKDNDLEELAQTVFSTIGLMLYTEVHRNPSERLYVVSTRTKECQEVDLALLSADGKTVFVLEFKSRSNKSTRKAGNKQVNRLKRILDSPSNEIRFLAAYIHKVTPSSPHLNQVYSSIQFKTYSPEKTTSTNLNIRYLPQFWLNTQGLKIAYGVIEADTISDVLDDMVNGDSFRGAGSEMASRHGGAALYETSLYFIVHPSAVAGMSGTTTKEIRFKNPKNYFEANCLSGMPLRAGVRRHLKR